MFNSIPSRDPQPQNASQKQSTAPAKQTPTHFQGGDRPTSTLNKLLKAGIDRQAASAMNISLAQQGDFPYHAGTLASGHIFVVSNQDRVFLGYPDELTEFPVNTAFRTRCIDNQKRVLESAGGLRITIEEQNGIRTAKASKLNRKNGVHEELVVAKPDGSSPLSRFITAKNSPH